MTTNHLPAPAAWLDGDGSAWSAFPGRTAENLARAYPDPAPFTPLYRAEDLPALVLPEVTEEDVEACFEARSYGWRWDELNESEQNTYVRRARAVRDSLESRMRKPTLADALPGLPDLGEGEWVGCDGDDDCTPARHPYGLEITGHGLRVWRCFQPATTATPADPDDEIAEALSNAVAEAFGLPERLDGAAILEALQAEGWKLVRGEGE